MQPVRLKRLDLRVHQHLVQRGQHLLVPGRAARRLGRRKQRVVKDQIQHAKRLTRVKLDQFAQRVALFAEQKLDHANLQNARAC